MHSSNKLLTQYFESQFPRDIPIFLSHPPFYKQLQKYVSVMCNRVYVYTSNILYPYLISCIIIYILQILYLIQKTLINIFKCTIKVRFNLRPDLLIPILRLTQFSWRSQPTAAELPLTSVAQPAVLLIPLYLLVRTICFVAIHFLTDPPGQGILFLLLH